MESIVRQDKISIKTLFFISFFLYFILFLLHLLHKFYFLQIALFLIVIILFFVCFYNLDKNKGIKYELNFILTGKEIFCLASLSVFFLILIMLDYKSWKYALIGDEYHFLEFARKIIDGYEKPDLFSEKGVYNFPVMSSLWQAFFMFLTRDLFFGWKLSSAVIIPLSIFPFYLWNKIVFNKKVAIVSLSAFVFAAPMLAFSHIGYNNIHSILFYCCVLLFCELAIEKNSHLFSYLCGLFLGLGFYTFHASRILIFVVPVYCFLRPRNGDLSKKFMLIFVTFLLSTIFLLLNGNFLQNIFERTLIGYQKFYDFNPDENERFLYIILNFVKSLIIFAYNESTTHFVYGPLTGYVGLFGVLIGIFLLIKNLKDDWRCRFILITYVFFAAALGALGPYKYPSNTRVMFLTPVFATIAGVGFCYLLEKIRMRYGVIVISLLIIASDAFVFYRVMPKKMNFTQQAYVIRTAQSIKDSAICYVGNESYSFSRGGLKDFYLKGRDFVCFSKPDDRIMDNYVKGRVCILSENVLDNSVEIEKISDKIIKNNKNENILYVIDFTGDNDKFEKFKMMLKRSLHAKKPERNFVFTGRLRFKTKEKNFYKRAGKLAV